VLVDPARRDIQQARGVVDGYVAVSRARHDVQIYTNDKAQLVAGLQRDVSQRSALEASQQVSKQHHSIGLDR
jgi:hypothetical protein